MTCTATLPSTSTDTARKAAREPHGTCGLIVRITPEGCRPTLYEARPLPVDRASDVIKVYSLTKLAGGDRYDVALTVDGVECSCPDFTYAREGKDPAGCKHCRALVALGLL